jgi:DNA-binding XRE family transcriptional regulator
LNSKTNLRKIFKYSKFAIFFIFYLTQLRFLKYSRHEAGILQFGKKVKELRLRKKLSQEQLAWAVGLEFSQINRIENGKINTSISNVFILAEALGVQPKAFFEEN